MSVYDPIYFFFFFNDTATTEIYTLSLHDALPICDDPGRADPEERGNDRVPGVRVRGVEPFDQHHPVVRVAEVDRKSTRLNSSHLVISYAVFCLKKKKKALPCATMVY